MSKCKGRVQHDKHRTCNNERQKNIKLSNSDLAANEPVDILYFNTSNFTLTIFCDNKVEYRLPLTVLRLIPATSNSDRVLNDTLMRGFSYTVQFLDAAIKL